MRNFKKGKIFPSEKVAFRDSYTNVTIWQMTNYPANHSTLYFTKSSFTPDGKKIVFLSCRSGLSNLFSADVQSGEIVQLTVHFEDHSITNSVHIDSC